MWSLLLIVASSKMLQYSRFRAVIFVAILRSTKQFCFRRRKTWFQIAYSPILLSRRRVLGRREKFRARARG